MKELRAPTSDIAATLLRAPYDYVRRTCGDLGSDLFEARLLLRRTTCMPGSRAAAFGDDPAGENKERDFRKARGPALPFSGSGERQQTERIHDCVRRIVEPVGEQCIGFDKVACRKQSTGCDIELQDEP
ncbi:hypothetical protein GRI62_09935 [Erythrobacter arachoides]|uniref:Uncharacterized protein n=1 Tax=Aurantiacibacter arachoides TaxID=1850444 RepID=A0A845A8N6_9SPHN|nr:hypothetical protein [Aurantiacibacter arachoides]MXO93919.1 hypothetical protein [Aurantiacibacter arachoides]GGD45606.1 hypothetical protein GCM10011411_01490 [Aurantiacibacter arachoides]